MKHVLIIFCVVTSSLCFSQDDKSYYARYYKNKPIIVFMIDGFGETYLKSTKLPTIEKFMKNGFYKTVDALMPTVTNCNNTSICCGEFPDKTGITGNSFLDASGKEEYMESPELINAPTLFEKMNKYGVKSALISSKKKSVALLSKGTDFSLSPETADSNWVKQLGKAPPIYSPEVNYWVMEALLYTLKNRKDISVFYVHTTDYPMHTWAPEDSNSIKHLKTLDNYLAKVTELYPEALVFITADHDVKHKDECVDIQKSLEKKNVKIKMAVSAERDKYLKHHRGFGGTSYVYLDDLKDEEKIKIALLQIKGVKTVLTKKEACKKYHLMPERVGDLVVLADSMTVFGDLENKERESLPATYRTHGSEYELKVPLIIYNAPKRPADTYFVHNKDLVSWLFMRE